MERQGLRALCRLAIASLAVAGSASMAAAVDFDFENPPYVAGGTIVGQDGWATNAYVPGRSILRRSRQRR